MKVKVFEGEGEMFLLTLSGGLLSLQGERERELLGFLPCDLEGKIILYHTRHLHGVLLCVPAQ